MTSHIEQSADLRLTSNIRFAVVIGSGVMGAGIAAHLANAGIRSLMLDIVPRELTAKEEAKGFTTERKDGKQMNGLVGGLHAF